MNIILYKILVRDLSEIISGGGVVNHLRGGGTQILPKPGGKARRFGQNQKERGASRFGQNS